MKEMKNLRKVCCILFFLFPSLLTSVFGGSLEGHQDSFFDHYKRPSSSCESEIDDVKCLRLDEMIAMAKENSFDSRQKVEQLYQARNQIRVRAGALLPHFNFSTLLGGVALGLGDVREGVGDLVSSLVGFIFPSRWFRWKESRLFYQAEKYGFLTLLSNQVNVTENLYYILHREVINGRIYAYYIDRLDRLIAFLKAREARGEATPQDVATLEVLRSDWRNVYLLTQNTLRDLFPQLIHALALDASTDWKKVSIALMNADELPDLSFIPSLEAEKLYPTVIDRSFELQSLQYLKYAAQYSRRARIFDFLSPEAGPTNSFGFGYLSYLRIGRSQVKVMQIKIEEERSLLKKAIYESANHYNTSIELFRESLKGREATRVLLEGIFDDFDHSGMLDIKELARSLEWSLRFDLYRNFSQHYFLMAESHVKRLLREGPHYEEMEDGVPAYRSHHSFRNRSLYLEDKEISRDIRSGKLNIKL